MATISDMRNALYDPRSRFRSLRRMVWDGEPILRSTLFAEARVECDGERLIVGMPLAALSLRRVERLLPLKRHLVSVVVPQMRILRDEMECDAGRSDILCEVLPDALPLSDAMAQVSSAAEAEAIVRALDALQAELQRVDLSHNNLREENILIDSECRLYPIRWYYATDGVGGDDEAFDKLRAKVARSAESLELHDVATAYNATPRLEGHLSVRPLHEGLAAVEDESGWGFVDCENRVVVEPKYLWVNNFREGRAEVQTTEGMGLVDRTGAYIVEPKYEIVEFDERRGCVMVRSGGEWQELDYDGAMPHSASPISPPARRWNGLIYRDIVLACGKEGRRYA